MGLLGDLTGQEAGGGQPQALASKVLEMLNNHPRGLAGMVQSFKEKGLGEIVSSWVGTGSNMPISTEQIQKALGNEQIQQLAGKLGLSTQEVSTHLSQLLPNVVDKLTPNGQVPSQQSLLSSGLNLLQSLFK